MAHLRSGVSDAFFHHTAIKELADKISTSVNQLYREQRPDPASTNREKSRARPSGVDDDGAGSGQSDDDGRQNEHWEDEDSDDFDTNLQCDDEDDEWDIEQSKAQVQHLLGSLNTDTRFDVMTKLNKWFSDKAKKVTHDIDLLVEMDDVRNKNEDDLKKSHIEVNKELEEREMHSFQVLNKFYLVLNNLGKKGKDVQDKEKKVYSRQAVLGTFERQQEESRNVQLESSIQDLRERLLSKEAEMRKGAQEAKEKLPKASDLLQVISAQQEEMALLTTRIETNEARVKTLKAALDYITCQHSAEPDQAVLDTIEEMKNQVRDARMADLMLSQDAEQRDMTVPDESELLELENECVTLRQQLQELEEKIREIEDPLSKRDEDQTITAENAPVAKSKLTAEVNKLQSENERLQAELQHYEELITQAEETLKMMEDQKVLFLENVARARKNLVAVLSPAEDDHKLPTQVVDNPVDVEMHEKHTRILASLKGEESTLIADIVDLETLLTEARAKVDEEKTKQTGLEVETAKQRKEYADIILQLETEVPKSLEEEEAHLQILQQENNMLLAKMEDLQKKLEAEDRRAKMDEQAATEAEMLVRDDFKKKKEQLDSAIKENQKETSPAITPPPGMVDDKDPVTGVAKDPQEAKLAELKAKQNQDIQELLKLQQENVELAKQIELIEIKIKMVKSNRGQPLDLSILKDTQAKDEDVPPENLEMRKEVRKKQRELNALRKKWWSDRQDPKASARRNIVSSSGEDGFTSASADPPNEQFDKIQAAITSDG
eukprot:GEMP01015344.1.p1 GENE.GEMP01015344.1~~GEMP01015344.1.p1  ORF type:complete len:778 (+),score=269.50 GEMP01015344.1:165-2498(+)